MTSSVDIELKTEHNTITLLGNEKLCFLVTAENQNFIQCNSISNDKPDENITFKPSFGLSLCSFEYSWLMLVDVIHYRVNFCVSITLYIARNIRSEWREAS